MLSFVLPAFMLLALGANPAGDPAAGDGTASVQGFDPIPAAGPPAPPDDYGRPSRPPLHCTADRRWCAQVDPYRTTLVLIEGAGQGAAAMRAWTLPLPLHEDASERDLYEVWPHLRVEADGAVLAGAVRRRSTGFAGGGAGSSHLILARLAADRSALSEAGELPLGAGVDIRACFDEDDRRARLDACSDEYAFDAVLAAEPVEGGPSRLTLTTRARTYPGRRSRTEDSLEGPPLRRRDLVWAEDAACSYRRTYTLDPATGVYQPDQPLPECSDYFDF